MDKIKETVTIENRPDRAFRPLKQVMRTEVVAICWRKEENFQVIKEKTELCCG